MKELTVLLKALADENRLRILKLLGRRKMCVCELAFVLGVTQPSISRHLNILKRAGLIQSEQSGFWTDYFVCKEDKGEAKKLCQKFCKLLDDDAVIKKDLAKAKNAKRLALCCKK
jgi:ArsR family transcriptional regulator